jgi:predicted Zn-dependent protease
MKIKNTSLRLIILVILFASANIIGQNSQNIKHKSSVNKNKFRSYETSNSILSQPSGSNSNKKTNKDFVDKQPENNKRDYKKNRDTGLKNNSTNYFHIDKSGESLWDGKHWDMGEYPLKVYVKENSSKYYKSSYKEYVSYAFSVWQKADSRIEYVFTNNSRNADIEFVFVENLGKKYEENYLGLTEYDTNTNKEIEHSKVQISLLKFGNEKVSAGEIKATIIHELGHAFGLGHSGSETDIMYPYISSDHSSKMTYDELSKGDKEAIKDVIDLGSDEQYVWK